MLSERKLAYWAEQVEIQAKVATAWTLRAERKHAEALTAMRAAASARDHWWAVKDSNLGPAD